MSSRIISGHAWAGVLWSCLGVGRDYVRAISGKIYGTSTTVS